VRGVDRRTFVASLAATGAGLALAPRTALSEAAGRIDVHHHFAPPAWLDVTSVVAPATAGIWKKWSPERTLAALDAGGAQKAILSITSPGLNFGDNQQARRLSRDANEYAAKLRSDHPGRFGAFAALPFPDIDGCLAEIAYALDILKCNGVGMFTSYGKTYLGDPVFAPIFAELDRRKAVVFVHPSFPACCTDVLPGISDADVEYGTDTSRAIARMVFGGNTVKYPNMRVIWSHAGGTMPFLQGRFVHDSLTPERQKLLPGGFFGEARKMYYDTAQSAAAAPMAALTKIVPLTQILFGSDYPYLSVKENVDGLTSCGVFDARQLAAIDRTNTVALLGA
jgi:predicted TIM-barrel fold metal-dependent hydrolase